MIDENPIVKAAGRMPERLGQERPVELILSRMHRTLADVVLVLLRVLGLFEFHKDVLLPSGVPTTVVHRLGRRPWGCVIARRDGPTGVATHYEAFTDEAIRLEADAGYPDVTVAFVLF